MRSDRSGAGEVTIGLSFDTACYSFKSDGRPVEQAEWHRNTVAEAFFRTFNRRSAIPSGRELSVGIRE
jgi:hypothetical protein